METLSSHSALHVKANLMHQHNVFLSFRNGYWRPMKAVFTIANFPTIKFSLKIQNTFFLQKKVLYLQTFR